MRELFDLLLQSLVESLGERGSFSEWLSKGKRARMLFLELEKFKFLSSNWERAFELADESGSGSLTMDEFVSFVTRISESSARAKPAGRRNILDDGKSAEELEQVPIRSWNTFVHQMGWWRYYDAHTSQRSKRKT